MVQRHDTKAQPHVRDKEPAGLDQPPPEGERYGLGLSQGPACLEEEEDLVEPAYAARVPAVAPRSLHRQREIQRHIAPRPPFKDDQRDASIGACSD